MQEAPILYDDLDERKLGRATRIKEEAGQQLNDEVSRRENQVIEDEAVVADTNNQNLREDALKAIELLQQSADPMGELAQMPPAIQAEVKAILDESDAQQQTQQADGQIPVEPQQQQDPTIGDGGQGNIAVDAPAYQEPEVNLPVLRAGQPQQDVPPEQKRLLPLT